MANSFPRPLVKRSAAIATANMIANTASIYGSYMYPLSHAPQYVPGGSANAAVCVIVALIALALRFVHIKENKKLEEAETNDTGMTDTQRAHADRRAFGFRYIY